jgi:uncharacterized membrane protein
MRRAPVRRTFGYVLGTIGLLLIFMAPLARFYVMPRVKKIPTDFYFREVSDGTASYLDPSAGLTVIGPVPVQNVTIQRGIVDDSTRNVAVWDQFSSLFDTQNGHQITIDVDRLTLDRRTAASVDCCAQNEDRTGSLTALFPIGTQKITYKFWDFNAHAAYDAVYKETTTLDGLTVYHFHQTVPPIQIKAIKLLGTQVGLTDTSLVDLTWWYSSETEIYVEPVTGGVIKGAQVADQWLEDSAGARRLTVAHVDAGWSDDTIKRAAHDANQQKAQLQLIQFGLPVYGAIAGVVLFVGGLVLLRHRRRPVASRPTALTSDTSETPESA